MVETRLFESSQNGMSGVARLRLACQNVMASVNLMKCESSKGSCMAWLIDEQRAGRRLVDINLGRYVMNVRGAGKQSSSPSRIYSRKAGMST